MTKEIRVTKERGVVSRIIGCFRTEGVKQGKSLWLNRAGKETTVRKMRLRRDKRRKLHREEFERREEEKRDERQGS